MKETLSPTDWYEMREGESYQETRDRRLLECPHMLTPAELEVLRQCRMTIWDGNVVSKSARNALFSRGLIVRLNGWQVVTIEGMKILSALGEMEDDRWPRKRK